MKKILLLTMLTGSACAADYELNVGAGAGAVIRTWGTSGKVNTKLYTVRAELWRNDVGLGLMYGVSDDWDAASNGAFVQESNTDDLNNISLMYKWDMGDLRLQAGLGYTDYTDRGKRVGGGGWSETDGDWSGNVGVSYRFGNWRAMLDYQNYYRSSKHADVMGGSSLTEGINLTVMYSFGL